MKPSEFVNLMDGLIKLQENTSVELGGGDTVFSGGRDEGVYYLRFHKLAEAAKAGEVVGLERAKGAKPYFKITFTELESMRVLAEFMGRLFKACAEWEQQEGVRFSDG